MRLNILNNYKTVYYNFLVSFYLCLNCILPYYDDVIISMQSNAIKLLIDNDKLNMKKVKKIRMIEFIDTLNRSDKIILDNEKDIIIVDYCIYECHESSNSNSDGDSSNPEKDPYEISKNKNIQNGDYIEKPEGPVKDCDVNSANTAYYNDVKYEVSTDATDATDATDTTDAPDTPDTPDAPDAPDTPDTPDTPDASDTPDATEAEHHASETEKEYIYDDNESENDSEESEDSGNDTDIDESIRYIFQKMERDKIKDD